MFTGQSSSSGGDNHSYDHSDGRHSIPEHAHTDAEREERQAALEDDVHGQTEASQGPQGQSGLECGQDTDRSKLL